MVNLHTQRSSSIICVFMLLAFVMSSGTVVDAATTLTVSIPEYNSLSLDIDGDSVPELATLPNGMGGFSHGFLPATADSFYRADFISSPDLFALPDGTSRTQLGAGAIQLFPSMEALTSSSFATGSLTVPSSYTVDSEDFLFETGEAILSNGPVVGWWYVGTDSAPGISWNGMILDFSNATAASGASVDIHFEHFGNFGPGTTTPVFSLANVVAVPEPSTFAALGAVATLVIVRRRRGKKTASSQT